MLVKSNVRLRRLEYQRSLLFELVPLQTVCLSLLLKVFLCFVASFEVPQILLSPRHRHRQDLFCNMSIMFMSYMFFFI